MTNLPSGTLAGLLLSAIPHLNQLGLSTLTASNVITATGSSRTTAYKAKTAVEAILPDLTRRPGRPPVKPISADNAHELRGKLLDFVYSHPGCVSGQGIRRHHSGEFRSFVAGLAAERDNVSLADFAEVVRVPLGTLKDWLGSDKPPPPKVESPKTRLSSTIAIVETVLNAYASWKGDFKAFCRHLWHDWRVELSRQHISDILEVEKVRIPKRRSRREPKINLGGFETFFPGAQWVGDGTELEIELWGRCYRCNLELNVDTYSAAFVGASLRSTEDSQAVIEAFSDGVTTTKAPPIALLLDNKASNHTAEVDEAVGDTLRIRSRLYAATDKPHVEGGFGLFKNEAPPLRITAETEDELAGQIVAMVVTTWLRAKNHKPRTNRGGNSRVELYQGCAPTEEDKAAAKKALRERKRKNDRARETRKRRQDPLVRAALDEAFERLGLDDPEGAHRIAIASWPFDSILAGIAIFEGKKRRGSLPDGVDGRYLCGIVRNVDDEAEVLEIGLALLDERLRARDRALKVLAEQRQNLEETLQGEQPNEVLRQYINCAMETSRHIDRIYWLQTAADFVGEIEENLQHDLLRLAVRHISAHYRVSKSDRNAAARFLLSKAVKVS